MGGRKLPPPLSIRAFEAVARLGSVTRAGEELGLSQPGVSYQLRLLERYVGGALLVRVGRRLVLTALGERIAPRLTRAFDSIAQAFAEAQSDRPRSLTISCSHVFGTNWLAPRIGRFQLANPNLAVRVAATDTLVDLESGDADIAIRNTEHPWPGLISEPIFASPIMPFAAPSLLAEHCDTADKAIALNRSSTNEPWWEMWYGQATGSPVAALTTGGLHFDNQVIDGNAAIAGGNAAVLNVLLWQGQIEQGLLEPVYDRVAFGIGVYWLCYPRHRANDHALQVFRAWLMAEAAETRVWFSRWCNDRGMERLEAGIVLGAEPKCAGLNRPVPATRFE